MAYTEVSRALSGPMAEGLPFPSSALLAAILRLRSGRDCGLPGRCAQLTLGLLPTMLDRIEVVFQQSYERLILGR